MLTTRLAELVLAIDERLGSPEDLTIVDIGAGDGSLIAAMRDATPELAERARWIAVDVRPIEQDEVISVRGEAPMLNASFPVRGLVMAHEWLDEIPCDVVQRDDAGVDRLVLVGPDGEEMGPALDDVHACAAYGVDAVAARAWMDRWWPLEQPGDRAEIGSTRDAAWAWMTSIVMQGVALATDYGHTLAERRDRRATGTLRAYREGRVAEPVPDGTVGITADVAVDACAGAVAGSTLSRQRDEVDAPAVEEITSVGDLQRYFEALRVRQPAGLGALHWLRWESW